MSESIAEFLQDIVIDGKRVFEIQKSDMILDSLKSSLDNNHPVICAIQAWSDHSDEKEHYVVAVGYMLDSYKEVDKVILVFWY